MIVLCTVWPSTAGATYTRTSPKWYGSMLKVQRDNLVTICSELSLNYWTHLSRWPNINCFQFYLKKYDPLAYITSINIFIYFKYIFAIIISNADTMLSADLQTRWSLCYKRTYKSVETLYFTSSYTTLILSWCVPDVSFGSWIYF